MLYISAEEVFAAASHDEVMDAIERAYALELAGKYTMPERIHVNHGQDTLLYMPCFLESVFGTKILSLFPGNAEKGLPVIEGLVLLNDASTGKPRAVIQGAALTALRTGAVGGVAVRHTVPEDVSKAGLIGAGVQGFQQLVFAAAARPIKEIAVFDLSGERAAAFCDDLRQALPAIRVEQFSSVDELLEASQLIITATSSKKPVLPEDKGLLEGRSYIGIGSYKPEMREFPAALFALVDGVFVDTEHGLTESGDLIAPLKEGLLHREAVIKMGHLIADRQRYRGEKETTLFKSVGMALFDIVVSELIYERAGAKGLGTVLQG